MTFEELYKGKKEFTIAYVGGSITEKSYYEKDIRYPKEFVRRMNEKVPEVHFTELNAATGGTPSALGLFKLSFDVLSKKPDMLFIEYSVNDNGPGEKMVKYFESITRNALRAYPDLPIVYLFAYAKGIVDGTTREEPALIYRTHKAIAEKYGIPCIDLAYALDDKIKEAEETGSNIKYTFDGVHPNDAGHSFYTDVIMENIFKFDFSTIHFEEETYSGTDYPDAHLIACENMELPEDWDVSTTRTLWLSPLHYIYSDKAGASVEFDFEGTTCGLYTRMEKDGGFAEVYIDGKYVKDISFWDIYCLTFERNAFELFTDSLEKGKHHVKIVIRENRDKRSEGHVARIAAFLVG